MVDYCSDLFNGNEWSKRGVSQITNSRGTCMAIRCFLPQVFPNHFLFDTCYFMNRRRLNQKMSKLMSRVHLVAPGWKHGLRMHSSRLYYIKYWRVQELSMGKKESDEHLEAKHMSLWKYVLYIYIYLSPKLWIDLSFSLLPATSEQDTRSCHSPPHTLSMCGLALRESMRKQWLNVAQHVQWPKNVSVSLSISLLWSESYR